MSCNCCRRTFKPTRTSRRNFTFNRRRRNCERDTRRREGSTSAISAASISLVCSRLLTTCRCTPEKIRTCARIAERSFTHRPESETTRATRSGDGLRRTRELTTCATADSAILDLRITTITRLMFASIRIQLNRKWSLVASVTNIWGNIHSIVMLRFTLASSGFARFATEKWQQNGRWNVSFL